MSPWTATMRVPQATVKKASGRRLEGTMEAAGILTHRSDRLDQSGGYGEASRGSCRC